MKLSIIIVSWNTQYLLAACLRSILENTGDDLLSLCEIVVVDNASRDGSAEMVRRQFAQVRLIENRGNVGFARANNQGIEQCSGEYVLLLNPDTLVRARALDALVAYMDENPSVAAAGPRLLNDDGTLQTSCYPAPTLTRELWRLLHLDFLYPYGIYRMQDWSSCTPREVDVVQGACFMVRRKTLEEVGLLDADYYMYTEEVDLCQRIRMAGWRIRWVPDAQVIHFGGQSTQQAAEHMFLELYRSKITYFRKHHGVCVAWQYKLILFFAALLRLLISPFSLLTKPEDCCRRQKLASHYSQLLRMLPAM